MIFNLSLQRCGTQSFSKLLNDAGIGCLHFMDGDIRHTNYGNSLDLWADYKKTYIDEYMAFSDFPVPLFVDYLFKEYPDATYICFTRDKYKWAESVQRHLKHHKEHNVNCFVDALFYKQYANVDDIFSMSIEQLITAHDAYFDKLKPFNDKIQYVNMDDAPSICPTLSNILSVDLPENYPLVDYSKQ